jgi:hypothetical protein
MKATKYILEKTYHGFEYSGKYYIYLKHIETYAWDLTDFEGNILLFKNPYSNKISI